MIKKLINFFKDEEGATMVEYALMVALIAVLCIGAVTALGGGIQTAFGNITAKL
jgi:pilus assembly protein Flp/PilA